MWPQTETATLRRLRLIADNWRGLAEGRQMGGSEEGSPHCDCDSVAHSAADADCDCVWNHPPPFPPLATYRRGSIKTQQFADFLFSSLALLSTLTSQPSSSSSLPPSSPLFIHNVNTDEKLLNHCNTKPTQSHCVLFNSSDSSSSSNSDSSSNSSSSSRSDCGGRCGTASCHDLRCANIGNTICLCEVLICLDMHTHSHSHWNSHKYICTCTLCHISYIFI